MQSTDESEQNKVSAKQNDNLAKKDILCLIHTHTNNSHVAIPYSLLDPRGVMTHPRGAEIQDAALGGQSDVVVAGEARARGVVDVVHQARGRVKVCVRGRILSAAGVRVFVSFFSIDLEISIFCLGCSRQDKRNKGLILPSEITLRIRELCVPRRVAVGVVRVAGHATPLGSSHGGRRCRRGVLHR